MSQITRDLAAYPVWRQLELFEGRCSALLCQSIFSMPEAGGFERHPKIMTPPYSHPVLFPLTACWSLGAQGQFFPSGMSCVLPTSSNSPFPWNTSFANPLLHPHSAPVAAIIVARSYSRVLFLTMSKSNAWKEVFPLSWKPTWNGKRGREQEHRNPVVCRENPISECTLTKVELSLLARSS